MVIGLFAPDPADGEFDFDAWNRTLVEGTREGLKPRQALELSNNFIATLIWENAKDSVKDSKGKARTDPQAQAYLKDVKQQLKDEYPGFKTSIQVLPRAFIQDQIDQLEDAIKDPEFSNTDVALGSAIYFEARAAAQAVVDENRKSLNNSDTYKKSAATKFLRDWLRIVADEITREHPDFSSAWKFVFERELNQDE